jgi:hypothetical protein
MPRRTGRFNKLGYALGSAFGPTKPGTISGQGGIAPEIIWLLPAGRSHRRTSGGEAELKVAHNI